jgi:hypothetical protein
MAMTSALSGRLPAQTSGVNSSAEADGVLWTTVTGATKLTVRSQLLTREGKVAFERSVNGNVRFFGSTMRTTHNLARNIAKTIKQFFW